MIADELRRQADVFLDISELRNKVGRDPGDRSERSREPRESHERHTPQFLQRPATTPSRVPAGGSDDFDEE
jgi:hypothetical protein